MLILRCVVFLVIDRSKKLTLCAGFQGRAKLDVAVDCVNVLQYAVRAGACSMFDADCIL